MVNDPNTLRLGRPGGIIDPRHAAVPVVDEGTRLYKWARELKPNWIGRIALGLYGCVMSWHEPVNDRLIWSFGYGISMEEAHEAAIRNMMANRVEGMAMWLPAGWEEE